MTPGQHAGANRFAIENGTMLLWLKTQIANPEKKL
jgi:hypothetical protein